MTDFSTSLASVANAPTSGPGMLKRPASDLNDITPKAAKALAGLEIKTIFDLATSPIFNSAKSLVTAGGQYAQFLEKGFVPPGVLDPGLERTWAEDIPNLALDKMVLLSKAKGKSLQDTLGVNSIADLANWSPFKVAVMMLNDAFPAESDSPPEKAYDPEMPPDLLPTVGDYPTEKVFYKRYFLDDVADVNGKEDLNQLKELDGQLDIMENYRESDVIGFSQPMVGVEVYASQSWYAKGVALGQLLHSMALAPGESTRIAVVDWSRQTRAGSSESMTEADLVTAANTQNRALSEVTSGVAAESQHGSSSVANAALAMQAGSSESGSALGAYNASGSQGMSANTSIASNVSATSGVQNVAARTQQAINDNTHQQSMAARTRRATVVQETFEKESETVTTRVVTNYNHMHAMSIQYYEVVQIYEVKTEIERMDRVLYVPMKQLNFTDLTVISRFKQPLYFAALNSKFQAVLKEWEGDFKIHFLNPYTQQDRDDHIKTTKARIASLKNNTAEDARTESFLFAIHLPVYQVQFSLYDIIKSKNPPLNKSLDIPQVINLEDGAVPFSRDATLRKIQISTTISTRDDDGKVTGFTFKKFTEVEEGDAVFLFIHKSGSVSEKSASEVQNLSINLKDYESLSLQVPFETNELDFVLLQFTFDYHGKELQIPWRVRLVKGAPTTLIQTIVNRDEDQLLRHLTDNALYYSQAIWRSMDRQMLTQMLANYKINGRSIGAYIDPQPVAISGNLMGFRWHFANKEDAQAFKGKFQHKVDNSQPITIPLPSGGVFAEAVLGRYNCAEKLDMTRFWNWQDSPIPIVAPEISAVQTGQHNSVQAPTPGNFSQPLAQLQHLNQMPDPSGMAEVMKALTAPNMFRDISGLAATVDLAKTGTTTAGAGAQAANEQANEAMKIGVEHQQAMVKSYLDHTQKMAETALPIIAGAATGGAGLAAGSISKAGAAVNMASKMDKEGEGKGGATNLMSTFSSLFGGLLAGKLKK